MAWNSSHSETKPLNGGRAEMAAAPTRKQSAGDRQAVDQPAQAVHVALAASVQHGAGTHEQQALEQRVVERVQQGRGERERRRRRQAVGR